MELSFIMSFLLVVSQLNLKTSLTSEWSMTLHGKIMSSSPDTVPSISGLQ